MNRAKNQLNAIKKSYLKNRMVLKLLYPALLIITLSSSSQAYTSACPQGDPLQLQWMQDLIASSNGCNIRAIIQFEHNGNTYFRTSDTGCLIENYYYFYNCQGEEVCEDLPRNGYSDDQCGEEILSSSSINTTTIWNYEDLSTPVNCPQGDPLQLPWMQDLIASSSGCNIEAIHQFEYEGNIYFRTADLEFSCFPDIDYRYFNCLGEEVCIVPSSGYTPYRCREEVVEAGLNFTNIWTYEDPLPNETCPPGEALQWDWMQDLIAAGDKCNIGTISQFDYEGNTYFMVRDGMFCGISDFPTYIYNCKGQLTCLNVFGYSSQPCDQNLSMAAWNGSIIWAYQESPVETCPEGDPTQWDWIRQTIESYDRGDCRLSEIRQIEFDNQTFFQRILGSDCSAPVAYFDCQGNLMCYNIPDYPVSLLCEQVYVASNNYTTIWAYDDMPSTISCPEGNPNQWDWIQDLVASNDHCFVGEIQKFIYDGETYFQSVEGRFIGYDCPPGIANKVYDCQGNFLCKYGDETNMNSWCDQEIIDAAQWYEGVWLNAPDVTSCSQGDPMQLQWIQDLIASSDGDNIAAIHQFEFEGNTHFQTVNADLDNYPNVLYFNCEGELLCEMAFNNDYFTVCDDLDMYLASLFDFTILWSFEDPFAAVTCPPGDPLQWNWVQDLMSAADVCEGGTIDQFDYNGNTYYQLGDNSPICNFIAGYKMYYNCVGDAVCYYDDSFGGTCDRNFLSASSTANNIWTYEPSANDICAEGDPLQWNWMQRLIERNNACYISEIQQFEYDGFPYFQTIAGEPESIPCFTDERNRIYNCEGYLICEVDSDTPYVSPCNQEIISASNNNNTIWLYEPSPETCPEGDPLQWDWVQNLVQSTGYCSIGEIRQFEYDGDTYIYNTPRTIDGGIPCAADFYPQKYYNCNGEFVCEVGLARPDGSGRCGSELYSAGNNYSTIWVYQEEYTQISGCTNSVAYNYNPNATVDDGTCQFETCPEGDPLQWNWIQDIIGIADGCARNEIRQYTYEGANYYYTVPEQGGYYFCPSGVSNDNPEYHYDCAGNLFCFGGFGPPCDSPILDGRDNYTTLWTYEDMSSTASCPEGDPLQSDWMQDLIANSNGYGIAEIHQFEYEGQTYFNTVNSIILTETYRLYFNCEGEQVCQLTQADLPNQCGEDIILASSDYTTIWVYGDEPVSMNQIKCPENNTISICAPVSIPSSMALQDFSTTADPTYMNSMSMQMEEQTEVSKYFNTTTRIYTISDVSGNQKTCETKYHIANQFLQLPEVSQPGSVCEENLWSYVKLGTDQYKIYADQNGSRGEIMSTCNTPSLICSTADLGVDTKVPDTYNFWASTYFEFPDGSICESEAMPFYVDVQAKPVAKLSASNKTLQVGEGMALMDMVTSNQSGYWSGDNIVYLMTASGDNIAYFSANTAGAYKLYYTVKNEFCERSYLMIVEVGGSSGKSEIVLDIDKQELFFVNLYPNPATGKVFIDLPGQSNYQIKLMDISGKVMKLMKTELPTFEMSVSDLSKGVYLVEVKNDMNSHIQKLVIE